MLDERPLGPSRSISTRSSWTSPTSRSPSPASMPARTGPTRSRAPSCRDDLLAANPTAGAARLRLTHRLVVSGRCLAALARAPDRVWRRHHLATRGRICRLTHHGALRRPSVRNRGERARAPSSTAFAIRTSEDVARELGHMKGALMKFGQLLSFIVEALPDDAQQALATLQSDAKPMAPALAAQGDHRRARPTAGAHLPRLAGRCRSPQPASARCIAP